MRIITCGTPTKLELFAAEELKRYIAALFNIDATISTRFEDVSKAQEMTFFLSSPSRLHESCAAKWTGELPILSAQGFTIRRVKENVVWLFGGSDIATLWAVYELVERWGVVYTLQEDIYPGTVPECTIPPIDEVFEPRQEIRSWRIINDLLTGPMSWSIPQQKKFINQLVKQKYNGIYLVIWPHHPFIDFKVDGISRTSASFNFGIPTPLTKDNIGREHLPDADSFTNPEFIRCKTFSEWYETGIRYISTIINHAKFYDMQVCIAIQPFDFPKEYAPLLEKPVKVAQLGDLYVGEGGDIFGERHITLLKAQLAAYLNTYPQADVFEIMLPEHTRSIDQFDEAWCSLNQRFGLSAKYNLEKLLYQNTVGKLAVGGFERSVSEGKMTIVMLDTFHKLLERTHFLVELQKQGKKLSISAGLSCPAIIPVVADALWEDAYFRLSSSYTSSRAVRSLRVLEDIDTTKVNVEQVITLQDDNVGSVPQVATNSIHRLVEFGVEQGWKGYYTRFWPIGDLDPVSTYLSKASWKNGVTPDTACYEHAAALYGIGAAAPFCQSMRLLEDATIILDLHHLGMLFPTKDCLSSRVGKDKVEIVTESLWHVLSTYEEVRAILSKTLSGLKSDKARAYMQYWIGRMDFSINILLGMSRIDDGNNAVRNSDNEMARDNYGEALDSFRQALQSLSQNVRDDSDRATLAVYYDILVREVGKTVTDILTNNRLEDAKVR